MASKAKEHQEFLDEQDQALAEYRVSGVVGKYQDPTRDQEPDIAPEFGVAPHPELQNPAPPADSFSGRALNPNSNPMVSSVEEKEEAGKEATEAFNEALAEREEKLKNLAAAPDFPAGAQPVYLVEKQDALEGVPALPPDESPKAREQSGDQLPQGVSQEDAKDSDKSVEELAEDAAKDADEDSK